MKRSSFAAGALLIAFIASQVSLHKLVKLGFRVHLRTVEICL